MNEAHVIDKNEDYRFSDIKIKTENYYNTQVVPFLVDHCQKDDLVCIEFYEPSIAIKYTNFLKSIGFNIKYDVQLKEIIIIRDSHNKFTFKLALIYASYLIFHRKTIISNITWIGYFNKHLTPLEVFIYAHYGIKNDYHIIPKKTFDLTSKARKIKTLFGKDQYNLKKTTKIANAIKEKNFKRFSNLIR